MYALRLFAFVAIATVIVADAVQPCAARSGPSGGFSANGPHHVYLVGRLMITEPRMVFDPQSPDKGEGYLTIENRGASAARLVAATSEMVNAIFVASDAETPQERYGLLTIQPHQTVQMKKNSVHFQFNGFDSDASRQPYIRVVLKFERAGPVHIDFKIDLESRPDK